MAEKKTDKSLPLCIISCLIPFLCYGVERMVAYQQLADKNVVLILAFAFTALAGLTYFIISRIGNSFYGMLAAILAFKMMPPTINNLINYSLEGQALFSLVQMASLLLFATLIIKHFMACKNSDKPIDALPIIVLVFAMAMLREPSGPLYTSLYYLGNQSFMGVYIAQALIYIWSVLIIYVTTVRSNAQTIKFVSIFEIVAMSINILRRLGTIVFCIANGEHISMSYYAWIAIYLVVMLLFAMLNKKVSKKEA